eukprot:275584_1
MCAWQQNSTESPSQFGGFGGYAGGGAGQFQSPMGGGAGMLSPTQPDRAGAAKVQSMTPMTCRQFASITSDGNDMMCDGKVLSHIMMYGRIQAMDVQDTFVQYTINDGTAALNCRKWATDDDDAAEREALRDGVYVKVIGRVNSGNASSFGIHHIAALTDFNEFTHHLLQAVYVHKVNVSQQAGGQAGQQVQGGQQFGGQMEAGQQVAGAGFGQQATGAGFVNGAGDLSDLEGQIKEIVHTGGDQESGMDIVEIINRMQGIDPNRLRQTIAHMVDEGILYSTIDENHVRCL